MTPKLNSDSFCILPWIHIHTNPTGAAAPCCIAESNSDPAGVGNAKTQSLIEIVNSDKMKQLRVDMLNGVKNPECIKCYRHDSQGVLSSRKESNRSFSEHYETAINSTQSDGYLTDFKMKYFDIRFNNICNFKCRTCGAPFSTQWEQEDLKNNVPHARIIPKNNSPKFLQEVVDQIENIELAYFAGGEPLITEEHYILLEEMIKQNRTDITLRYSTNLSNLKFKDKDLLGLWKHFSNKIQVYASIDHFGKRAEYIRNGTEWTSVEENFIKIRESENIQLQINSVLSVFNVLTINDFYQYLIDRKLYNPTDGMYALYNLTEPNFLSIGILPAEHKTLAKQSIQSGVDILADAGFSLGHANQLKQAGNWLFSTNTWEENKEEFRNETRRLDAIRGEDFAKTFPELAGLL